ncbi:MAG: hypothetical protein JWM61_3365 [Micrococcaceae bacterium]|jgi:hypothetical protein|uniref:Uncharacterized protein n=1 Tax=Arthrobacter cheniae TaxID=1258888 RepID=A0A3A5M820_9MICC|nr:hypothetical protein [Arthrobacter cheniae]MCU1634713.1 hypothetical protein [Micrococcaceae bacterium]RJT80123.1 hypothetical protein D6T63_09660 [Arthrobacter cheniae]
MTENAHGGHIVNPNKGDGSTSDPNWHGDIGDQGNDLRFAEEQALIKEQADRADRDPSEAVAASEQEGHYTSSEPAEGSGGYTSAQDPVKEGEYTDKDRPLVDDPEGEGEYTDRDR